MNKRHEQLLSDIKFIGEEETAKVLNMALDVRDRQIGQAIDHVSERKEKLTTEAIEIAEVSGLILKNLNDLCGPNGVVTRLEMQINRSINAVKHLNDILNDKKFSEVINRLTDIIAFIQLFEKLEEEGSIEKIGMLISGRSK